MFDNPQRKLKCWKKTKIVHPYTYLFFPATCTVQLQRQPPTAQLERFVWTLHA